MSRVASISGLPLGQALHVAFLGSHIRVHSRPFAVALSKIETQPVCVAPLGLEFYCHWLPGADAPGYFMPLLRSFFWFFDRSRGIGVVTVANDNCFKSIQSNVPMCRGTQKHRCPSWLCQVEIVVPPPKKTFFCCHKQQKRDLTVKTWLALCDSHTMPPADFSGKMGMACRGRSLCRVGRTMKINKQMTHFIDARKQSRWQTPRGGRQHLRGGGSGGQ